MVVQNHYDDETLNRLLLDRLGSREHEVATHVEFCDTCQSRLETISSAGMTWDEVSGLLCEEDALPRAETGSDKSDFGFGISFLEPGTHPDSLGKFARYEIMEILGRGGMGIVMRGFDPSLNRHSAIKVLAPELATSAAARKRFSREARSAAAVVHPHVIPIQTVDEYHGLPYLVMPVVEGQSLDQRVKEDGTLKVIEAVRVAAQVAEGLSAAHEQGLVHRDIKPANVLLEFGVERVQLTDFGLARAIDDASMTRSGVIAGTPQYMSPEQAHGDSIDHRSDLFSLGSLMYFMLAGHSPFRAETTMGVLNRIGNDEPRSLRSINAEVPEWLEQIVMKLLSKSADSRFQTAADVAELLQNWNAHLQQPASTPKPQQQAFSACDKSRETGRLPPRIGRWLIATAAFSFLAIVGTIIVLETGKGTLRIETNSDTDIPIVIRQGDKEVDRLIVSTEGASTRLHAGNYVIEIDGDHTEFTITGNKVQLSRRGNWVASIQTIPNSENVLPTSVDADSVATLPFFETPEVLMQHFAECQFRSDTAGCINCYSDKVIHEFATSYLMMAMLMRNNGNDVADPIYEKIKSDPKNKQMLGELETILSQALIDDPPAIASAALQFAANSYHAASDDAGREKITNDELLLIASSPTLLKNPRKFVTDFAIWSEGHEDQENEQRPRSKIQYRIEFEGKTAFAVDPNDGSRFGLKQFGATWLIHQPWPENDDTSASATPGNPTKPGAAKSKPAKRHQPGVSESLITFEFHGTTEGNALTSFGIGWVIGENGQVIAPSHALPECDTERIEIRTPEGRTGLARRIGTNGHFTVLMSQTAANVPVVSIDDIEQLKDGDVVFGVLNATNSTQGTCVQTKATVILSEGPGWKISPPQRFYGVIQTDLKWDEATHTGAPLLTADGNLAGMIVNAGGQDLIAIPINQLKLALNAVRQQSVATVIETMEGLSREGRHREWLALVDDEEIDRFAGMMLIGRAQKKMQITLLGELAAEVAKTDQEIASALQTIARTDPLFRTDPPDNATAALNLLNAIVTAHMAGQVGTPFKDLQEFRTQLHSIDSYSELLRSASGVLIDPRDFIATMMHNPLLNHTEFNVAEDWDINVNGAIAVATKQSSSDNDESSASSLELRITNNGDWRISKLISDEGLINMMLILTGTTPPETPAESVNETQTPVKVPGLETQ